MKMITGHEVTQKNAELLTAQAALRGLPPPTVIGGYKQWQEHGRTVKKGEKSLKLMAPVKRKDSATTDFRIVSVFDINQTMESIKIEETQS